MTFEQGIVICIITSNSYVHRYHRAGKKTKNVAIHLQVAAPDGRLERVLKQVEMFDTSVADVNSLRRTEILVGVGEHLHVSAAKHSKTQ